MHRKPVDTIPGDIPQEIRPYLTGAALFNSSCSRLADVYYLDKDAGYYLKCTAKGTLEAEAQLTQYFHRKGLGPEVLQYVSADRDWMLTAAVPGEDGTWERYRAEPEHLCDLYAQSLRTLHEIDCTDCPVSDRITSYLDFVQQRYETGIYSPMHTPDNLSLAFSSAEEAYQVLQEGKGILQRNVLLHGDYCLPNIMLQDWQFTGFIDVGNGGVGDPGSGLSGSI